MIPGRNKFTLIKLLDVSESTFHRNMDLIIERTDFIDRFPYYNKRSRILPKDMFFFLCSHFGIDKHEIADSIIDCFDIIEEKEKRRITSLFNAKETISSAEIIKNHFGGSKGVF